MKNMTKDEIYNYNEFAVQRFYYRQATAKGIDTAYLGFAKFPIGLNMLSSFSKEYFQSKSYKELSIAKDDSQKKSFLGLSNFLMYFKWF
jgi:hypothetical protein